MTYSEKLKDPRWQKKRLEILDRDKFTCKKCGDGKTTLHVHHLIYIKGKNPWEYNKKDLITLCEDCHKSIESIKEINPDFEYSKCKIYKSNKWEDDLSILFCSINSICYMRIYDKKGEVSNGFQLISDIPAIIDILKFTQNG